MDRNPSIAIVGATGMIGNEVLGCLEESEIEFSDLRLFASADSEGEIYSCRDAEYKVERLEDDSFEDIDFAIFAVNATLSASHVPVAVEAGARVIDISGNFRADTNVPLVVPGVNPESLSAGSSITALPGPAAIMLAPVLKALNDAAGLGRIVISTYQSVSGAGKVALDELWSQTLAIFNQRPIVSEAFQHQIAFNCIPQVDVLRGDGYTKEEVRIVEEVRRVLQLPGLAMSVTAVRVPVFHSYAMSVNVELERRCTPEDCISALQKVPVFEVSPDPMEYPMHLSAAGTDPIHVGRIRSDASVPHGLNMWIAADNVRRGAAVTAIEVLGELIKAG